MRRDGDELSSGWRQVKDHAAASGSASRGSWWLPLFGMWLALSGAMVLGVLVWSLTVPATPVSGSPPTPVVDSSSTSSVPTYPAEIIAAARAVSTFLAPTPSPTRAPMRPTRTPSPQPFLCPGDPNTLPNGTVCTGAPPLPTPTVMPTCLVPPTPGLDCMVRHSRSGTPVATLPITNALVSGANDVDHEQIRRDAENYPLSPEFAALRATPLAGR